MRFRWFRRRKAASNYGIWKSPERYLAHVVVIDDIQVCVWKRSRVAVWPCLTVTLHQRFYWRARREYRAGTHIDAARIRLALMALELAQDWILAQERHNG
jgi:hypothetical protein